MGNLLNFLVNRKAFEAPYERSLLFTFLMPMLFINFSKSNIKYIDVAISVAGIFFMGIEPILYKEEFSLKKILFRLINVIIITIILIYNPLINSGVQCSMLFAIGYFSLSIFVQIYKLYINPSIQVTEKLETQNNINEIINSIICDNNNSLNDNAEGTSNVITNNNDSSNNDSSNNDSSNNDSSNNELNADDACNIEKK